jgi:threonine dehydrogenase-like Zn-dependent dehydrogenase
VYTADTGLTPGNSPINQTVYGGYGSETIHGGLGNDLIYAGSPADHWRAGQLIRAGVLDTDRLITHRFPLIETQEGFRLVAEAGDSLKVIIEPQK